MSRRLAAVSSFWQRRWFSVPKSYKPNKPVKHLPFSELTRIWLNSFRPNTLSDLQHKLITTMIPPDYQENTNLNWKNEKIRVDEDGNHINEINFTITNGPNFPTKHVVFVHGYGASLGCFARNFQFVNQLKGSKFNYKVHFLDNISFALSSNPKAKNKNISYWKVPKCPTVKIHDSTPNDSRTLHNKYYKLVDSYEVDPREFTAYKEHMTPIVDSIEHYYLSALDGWRANSGIDAIDFLIGHSYGGYWSGSYAVKFPDKVQNLILLSPVGVERHVHAIANPVVDEKPPKPTLDPTKYNFLSRLPILPRKHYRNWYFIQPFLPRILRYLGPWGVRMYREMWYAKLFKINKIIDRFGGPHKVFKSQNDLIYGTNEECNVIIEYLYNSITTGTVADIYLKNILTPSTTSKVPLYDKFANYVNSKKFSDKFKFHIVYGQFDFMNSEAGSKLVDHLVENSVTAKFHTIKEGGHNLYIDNPFDTNKLLTDILTEEAPKL